MQILWRSQGHTVEEPTAEQSADLLRSVRANVSEIEQGMIKWGNEKLAKPPRSGLWSNLAPHTIGWLFLMIVGVFLFIGWVSPHLPP